MSRFRPRLAGALLVFLLILLAADYGGWLWLTGRMREGYAQWQATLAADGWQVTSAAPVATGWPLAARLELDQPRLSQGDGGFAWRAARASFGISILHPGRFVIVPQGAQTLSAAGWAPLQFHATAMRIEAPLGAPVQQGVADATGLTFGTPVELGKRRRKGGVDRIERAATRRAPMGVGRPGAIGLADAGRAWALVGRPPRRRRSRLAGRRRPD
jgi:hypothetical protein